MRNFFAKVDGHKKSIVTAFYLIALALVTWHLYERITGFYVTADFDKLGPVSRSMPVYYKGFKVGKTIKITPGPDFKSTGVRIYFYHDMSILPGNIYATVRKFENNNAHYLEIEYPETNEGNLRKGSIITGKTEADINSFMSAQVENGAFGAMQESASKAIDSLAQTSDSARDMINEITKLIDAARPDILNTTHGLAQMADSVGELTEKLNASAPAPGVDEASANIGKTIANIESVTAKLDTTMDELNATMDNVRNITAGVNQTLSKRFGGARLIVGTPVPKTAPATNAAAPVTPPALRPPACP